MIRVMLAEHDEVIENFLLAVEPDGLVFAAETVAGQSFKEDADYSSVRVTFQASLENARVPMQIDIGFGDTVVPDAAFADYPAILDHAQPRLRAYPKETVVAEKFEAMVKLGQLNSRLKDFFDLWLLSRQFEFAAGCCLRRSHEHLRIAEPP